MTIRRRAVTDWRTQAISGVLAESRPDAKEPGAPAPGSFARKRSHARYDATHPASAGMQAPLILAASSDARNRARLAMSLGSSVPGISV
jgi:hypothetical protein